MKVYLITEKEITSLLALLDRDPTYGRNGGSSIVLTKEQREFYEQAHAFYNYQVRTWIDQIKGDK